jgi:glucose-1-phosphate thymidylyltransferase
MDARTAVVLAAGEGQRLRPLTKHRPKPMLPAANRPILEYVLDALVDAGLTDLHLVVGYRRDRVQSAFGSTYRGHELTYHGQSRQLGSGHALLQARAAVDGEFLVVNGDEVITADTVAAVTAAHEPGDTAAIAVVESARAPEYGAVRVDEGFVTELTEKPGEGTYRLLNAGVYALDESIFGRLDVGAPVGEELALTDVVATAVADGERVRAVRSDDLWVDTTYPWDLPTLAEELLAVGLVDEPETDPGVYVDPAAGVHGDATLRAPVVVGPDATVGPGAVVGPHTALGANATVGAGAVVDRSVVDADAVVGTSATVIDAVIGQAARVGPGTTVPGGEADVAVGTVVHEGVRLGAVVADRATVGGGATLVPGTLVGPNATVAAGRRVAGTVRADADVL